MDLAALQAAGVTAVLQAGVELVPSHPELFQYEQLACSDTETHDMVSHFQKAFAFIDEGRKQGRVSREVSGKAPQSIIELSQLLPYGC